MIYVSVYVLSACIKKLTYRDFTSLSTKSVYEHFGMTNEQKPVNVCKCIHVCMYACVCVYIYVYVYSVYIYVYIYICITHS
jgi:hypothetical protein